MSARPSSWYAQAQPYTLQAPGQQGPLPLGAPDFPPVSAAAPAEHSTAYAQQLRHGVSVYNKQAEAGSARPTSPEKRTPRQYRYSNPVESYITGDQNQWMPGHKSAHSHSVGANIASEDHSQVHLPRSTHAPPARPVSPRPQLKHFENPPHLGSNGHHDRYSHPSASTSSLQSSESILERTLPSPHFQPHSPACLHNGNQSIITAYQAPLRRHSPQPDQSVLQHFPQFSNVFSRLPNSGGARKRPLPTLPNDLFPIQTKTQLPSVPSPALSQSKIPSPSVSSASGSHAGSFRRPLPKPPSSSPSLQDNRPTKFNQASKPPLPEQAIASDPSCSTSTPIGKALHAPPQKSQTNSTEKQAESVSSEEGAKSTDVFVSLPTFAFDSEPKDDDACQGSGPSISISVAPPSPSLFKATSDNYFEAALEDERHPLPVSSVPMATTTKAYALACPGCSKPVLYGRTVNAMGKRWHPECFKCVQCAIQLEHFEFFTKDAKPYCHVDYHEVRS